MRKMTISLTPRSPDIVEGNRRITDWNIIDKIHLSNGGKSGRKFQCPALFSTIDKATVSLRGDSGGRKLLVLRTLSSEVNKTWIIGVLDIVEAQAIALEEPPILPECE